MKKWQILPSLFTITTTTTTNWQLTAGPSRLRPTQLRTFLLLLNLFRASFFTSSKEVHISFKTFLTALSHLIQERPAFPFVQDSWPARAMFGNLSFGRRRTCPTHLIFCHIVALESGIALHFFHCILFQVWSCSWVPKTIVGTFSGKHLVNLPPFFGEPSFQNHIWLLSSL